MCSDKKVDHYLRLPPLYELPLREAPPPLYELRELPPPYELLLPLLYELRELLLELLFKLLLDEELRLTEEDEDDEEDELRLTDEDELLELLREVV